MFILVLLIFLIGIVYFTIKHYQLYYIKHIPLTIKGSVIKVESYDSYQKITIRFKIFKIVVNDSSFKDIKIGDIISVNGSIKSLDNARIPNGFDYKQYFYNNLYLYNIKSTNIEVIGNTFSVYKIQDIVNKYLDTFFKDHSLSFLKAFIIGDSSLFNDDFKDALKTNGILHLFAISGLHVTLLIDILSTITKSDKQNTIINLVLLIYLFITGFSVSISRAIYSYFLKNILKKRKINISSIDNLSIVFIIMIIFNPFLMYNNGFILSFMASFVIILANVFIKNKNYIKSIIFITIIVNVFSFPIVVNMNNEYNLLTPLINVVMIFIVESIILPSSILTFIFPIFKNIYNIIISSFVWLNNQIALISWNMRMVITIKSFTIINMTMFYFALFLLIVLLKKKKNRIIILTFIVIILINISIVITKPKYSEISFLDLNCGEAILIKRNKENILIDTGDGSNNEVSSFLKSKGINTIHYLIITHKHNDHNGEYEYIKNKFIIKNLIINAFDDYKYSNAQNIIKVKDKDIIKTKTLTLNILNPKEKDSNENNNSIVIYTIIDGLSFLFTGDIEEEIEKRLNVRKIDVLKVAHHGSYTSSSFSFLQRLDLKYAIIMTGRNNTFDFPSPKTISSLDKLNVKTYYTLKDYSIILTIKNNQCYFKTLNNT